METDRIKLAEVVSARLKDAIGAPREALSVKVFGDEVLVQIDPAQLPPGRGRRLRARITEAQSEIGKEIGKPVWIVETPDQILADYESELLQLVNSAAPASLERIILVRTKVKSVRAWGVQIGNLPAAISKRISRMIADLLKIRGLEVDGFALLRYDHRYPGNGTILRVVKLLQPVDMLALASALREEGYDGATDVWLQKELDNLRQVGLVALTGRRTDHGIPFYALTYAGLLALPSQNGRTASDIVRALGLKTKRW